MYTFHTNVFALPDGVETCPSVTLRGLDLATLRGADGGPPLFTAPLKVEWDEVQRRLLEIPRMDHEPDGYFLVIGHHNDTRWQIDGYLYEYHDAMHRMEIHGSCPQEIFDMLLGSVGWPAAAIAFELVQEGVTLDEANFRRWAMATP